MSSNGIRPATYCRVTPETHQLRQYWKLEPGCSGSLPTTDDDWADALTEALERAVEQRMAGPERVGSKLSGGLDSTSLTIIAGQQLLAAGRPPLPMFSRIDSGLSGCLETKAVRELAGMPCFIDATRGELGKWLSFIPAYLPERLRNAASDTLGYSGKHPYDTVPFDEIGQCWTAES